MERDKAGQHLKDWVKSRWFAPGEFKRRGVRGTFQGVYFPYWTYDANTVSRYTGQRGEYYWVNETYTTTVNGKSQTLR